MSVTAATVWEVRTAGNSTNGAGFDSTIAGAGADMSIFDNKNSSGGTNCQSTTANLSTTDAVTNNTTTVTSATANFTSALVGNTIYLSGTGTTTGRYQVTGVTNSTTVTVDRPTGSTGGTGVTMNIGGAAVSLTDPPVAAGNTVYVKADGTYSITATQTFNTAGGDTTPITYIGYTSSRTDNGQVTVQRSSGNITMFSITGAFRRFYNFIGDGISTGTVTVFSIAAGQCYLQNCAAKNFTTAGFSISSSASKAELVNCRATGGTSAITAAYNMAGNGSVLLVSCIADTNAGIGFLTTGTSSTAFTVYIGCIAANNTGSTSYDGFKNAGSLSIALQNCIAYGNGGNGLLLDNSSTASSGDGTSILNCIFVSNGLYGINSNTNNYNVTAGLQANYNAFYNNSSGPRNNLLAGPNSITLTGDPFTNGASLNFALNNTASAGASCRAAGFPGAMVAGGTGYLDIGALQHQDTGGSAGMLYIPSLEGV